MSERAATASEERLEDLLSRIEEVESLASPPVSLDRILALAGDPDSGVTELAGAVRIDPAIVARVLRLANSAYFGFSRRVESVEDAVMVIGFRNVRNLAACAAVAPVFSASRGIDRAALWRHSCAVAEATRLVALKQRADDGPAYVCGLLHDLGQVVLEEVLGEEYAELVEKQRRPQERLSAAETRTLGADHSWAGSVLLERWQLAPGVASALRRHHVPDGAESHRIALAEHLAEAEGFVDPSDPAPCEKAPPASLLEALSLRPADAEQLAVQLHEKREAIDMLYQESLGDPA